MRTMFAVKNQTGETWPAYGLARLGDVLQRDGANTDLPLYDLLKPDGEDGIYVVNGAGPLADDKEGTAVYCQHAQYVYCGEETVEAHDLIGPVSGEWHAAVTDDWQFRATDDKDETLSTAPVVWGATGGGGASSDECPCECVASGDDVVEDVPVTTRVDIPFNPETFHVTNGRVIFAGGTISLLMTSPGVWEADIGAYLTSVFTDGEDATPYSTLDGDATLTWSPGNPAVVTLCVDGEIPEGIPSGSGS